MTSFVSLPNNFAKTLICVFGIAVAANELAQLVFKPRALLSQYWSESMTDWILDDQKTYGVRASALWVNIIGNALVLAWSALSGSRSLVRALTAFSVINVIAFIHNRESGMQLGLVKDSHHGNLFRILIGLFLLALVDSNSIQQMRKSRQIESFGTKLAKYCPYVLGLILIVQLVTKSGALGESAVVHNSKLGHLISAAFVQGLSGLALLRTLQMYGSTTHLNVYYLVNALTGFAIVSLVCINHQLFETNGEETRGWIYFEAAYAALLAAGWYTTKKN